VIQADLIAGFGTLGSAERRGLANGLEKWLEASGLGGVRSAMIFEKPLLTDNRRTRPKRAK
jgi:hypothetical protein